MCFKAEPTIFFRCLIGKEPIDTFICKDCLKKTTGETTPLAVIGEEIVSVEQNVSKLTESQTQQLKTMKCDKCGTNINDISNTGKMGCENCYYVFSDLIAMVDKDIHSDKEKIKKALNEDYKNKTWQGRINILEQKMSRMIKEEKYEEAAKLRDLINAMKEEHTTDEKPK